MGDLKLAKSNWRALAVCLGLLGSLAACGTREGAPSPRIPSVARITSISIAGTSASLGQSSFPEATVLDVGVRHDSRTLNFSLPVSATPASAPPQEAGGVSYAFESLCLESGCDWLAFLLKMTPVDGQSVDPALPASSRVFLFRADAEGGLKPVAARTGKYATMSEAIAALSTELRLR